MNSGVRSFAGIILSLNMMLALMSIITDLAFFSALTVGNCSSIPITPLNSSLSYFKTSFSSFLRVDQFLYKNSK
ncbi:MAG: hypothetical protein LBT66_02700 [Methanobrevibacter sp.]|nr:hypothetical protein [Candidatus Methanovirga meridionalis]